MEEYQKRVIVEKKDLDYKIVRLTAFLFSDDSKHLDEEEFIRMEAQLQSMTNYSHCLRRRIAAFKKFDKDSGNCIATITLDGKMK